MARYEYRCSACTHDFEVRYPMRLEPRINCPKCGHVAEKRMSDFSFSFGFRLSDRCNERFGPKDEVVRNI